MSFRKTYQGGTASVFDAFRGFKVSRLLHRAGLEPSLIKNYHTHFVIIYLAQAKVLVILYRISTIFAIVSGYCLQKINLYPSRYTYTPHRIRNT